MPGGPRIKDKAQGGNYENAPEEGALWGLKYHLGGGADHWRSFLGAGGRGQGELTIGRLSWGLGEGGVGADAELPPRQLGHKVLASTAMPD